MSLSIPADKPVLKMFVRLKKNPRILFFISIPKNPRLRLQFRFSFLIEILAQDLNNKADNNNFYFVLCTVLYGNFIFISSFQIIYMFPPSLKPARNLHIFQGNSMRRASVSLHNFQEKVRDRQSILRLLIFSYYFNDETDLWHRKLGLTKCSCVHNV